MPHRALSAPFPLRTLDLQARVDALTGQPVPTAALGALHKGQGGEAGSDPVAGAAGTASCWEWDKTVDVQVTAAGTWNAVAFWFDAELGPGGSAGGEGESGMGASTGGGGGSGGVVVLSSYAQGRAGVAGAPSWEQALQYVDPVNVSQVRACACTARIGTVGGHGQAAAGLWLGAFHQASSCGQVCRARPRLTVAACSTH